MAKPTIKYEDFAKIEIRTGTILGAEKVEDSTKLIKLMIDIGEETPRTILTGMQKWYSPEEFVGMQTLVLANLEPRKMAGTESQGMLLSIGSDDNAKPILILPKEPARNGDEVL